MTLYDVHINDNDCGSEGQRTASSDVKLGITLWATRKGVFLHCLPDPIRLDSRLYTPLDASRDGIDTTARFELSSRLTGQVLRYHEL